MKRFLFLYQAILFLTFFTGCKAQSNVSLPKEVTILTRKEWAAAAPARPVIEHVPVRITIHHTGAKQNPKRTLEEKLKGLQRYSIEDSIMGNNRAKKLWADIPYHFYIAMDGAIGEGRELKYVGESNTPYNPTGHALIVLEGSFDKEEVSEAQYQSLLKLVLSISKQYKISADKISGHKDHASTGCPGENLYTLIPKLQRIVEEAGLKR